MEEKVEYKKLVIRDLNVVEGEKGVFEGYAAVFDKKDRVNDIIERGAFKRCLASKNIDEIDMCYEHKLHEIIGEFTEIIEDEKGLRVKGRLFIDEIQRASETYALMKRKKLKSMSIGYIVKDRRYKFGTRHILDCELIEISLVRRPVNVYAKVTEMKHMNQIDIDELESLNDVQDMLRDSGFSRKAAVGLIAKVAEFKSIESKSQENKKDDLNESKSQEEKEKEELEKKAQAEKEEAEKKAAELDAEKKSQEQEQEALNQLNALLEVVNS